MKPFWALGYILSCFGVFFTNIWKQYLVDIIYCYKPLFTDSVVSPPVTRKQFRIYKPYISIFLMIVHPFVQRSHLLAGQSDAWSQVRTLNSALTFLFLVFHNNTSDYLFLRPEIWWTNDSIFPWIQYMSLAWYRLVSGKVHRIFIGVYLVKFDIC